MAKRDTTIYLKLPEEIKKRVDREAKRNMRTSTQQVQLFIEKGLHDLEFVTLEERDADRDSKNS